MDLKSRAHKPVKLEENEGLISFLYASVCLLVIYFSEQALDNLCYEAATPEFLDKTRRLININENKLHR